MSNHYIDEFDATAVKELTGVLSLPPITSSGEPSKDWLAEQREKIKSLPKPCLKPPLKHPLAVMMRGLMLASERRDLPFIPMAAVLCKSHQKLHPWRLRSLFLLLASEVGIKSDRIRRHKGFCGLPPSREVSGFVRRMTSIASLWVHPDDFEKRFGFRTDMFPFLESGCEACMLAMVGSRGQLLADLRANMIARHRTMSHCEPAFMRFVNAWIEWFGDDKAMLLSESEKLGSELTSIRELSLRERRGRYSARRAFKDANQDLKKHGKKLAEPGRYHPRRLWEIEPRQRNPIPRPLSLVPVAQANDHVYDVGRPASASGEMPAQNQDVFVSGALAGDDVSRVETWRQNMDSDQVSLPSPTNSALIDPDSVSLLSPTPSTSEEQRKGDGQDERDPYWADDVGSYYFRIDNSTSNNVSEADGSKAKWKPWDGVEAAGPMHPALQQRNMRPNRQAAWATASPSSGRTVARPIRDHRVYVETDVPLSPTDDKWADIYRSSASVRPLALGGMRRQPSRGSLARRRPSVSENTHTDYYTATAQSDGSTAPTSLSEHSSTHNPRGPGGYGDFNSETVRHSAQVRERHEASRWPPAQNLVPGPSDAHRVSAAPTRWTGVSVKTYESPSARSSRHLDGDIARGERCGSSQSHDKTLAILEGRSSPSTEVPDRVSVRQAIKGRRPSWNDTTEHPNPFTPTTSNRHDPRIGSSVYSASPGGAPSSVRVVSTHHDGGRFQGRTATPPPLPAPQHFDGGRFRGVTRGDSSASRIRESSGTELGGFLQRFERAELRPEDSISAVDEREEREREKKKGIENLIRRR